MKVENFKEQKVRCKLCKAEIPKYESVDSVLGHNKAINLDLNTNYGLYNNPFLEIDWD